MPSAHLPIPLVPLLLLPLLTAAVTITDCSDEQSSSLQATITHTRTLLTSTSSMLSSCPSGEPLAQWLGAPPTPAHSATILQTLHSIQDALASDTLTLSCRRPSSCSSPSSTSRTYSGTSFSTPSTLQLCPSFWQLYPRVDASNPAFFTQPGELIYRLARMENVVNPPLEEASPRTGGTHAARALAWFAPAEAVRNAPGYQFLVESQDTCAPGSNAESPVQAQLGDTCAEDGQAMATVTLGTGGVSTRATLDADLSTFFRSSGVSSCGSSSSSPDAYVRIEATVPGHLSVRVESAAFEAALGLRDSCTGSYISCSYSDEHDLVEASITDTVAPLYVRVATRSNTPGGNVQLKLVFDAYETGAPGSDASLFTDTCEDASMQAPQQFLTNGSLPGDFFRALPTPSGLYRGCSRTLDARDVWLPFNVTYITTLGYRLEPDFATPSLYLGCGGSTAPLRCGSTSAITVIPGRVYSIRAAADGLDIPFHLEYELEPPAAPTSSDPFVDECPLGQATDTPPIMDSGDSIDVEGRMVGRHASSLTTAGLCSDSEHWADAWYEFEIPGTKPLSVSVIVTSASFDPVVSLHSACTNTKACDDNSGERLLSRLTMVTVDPGRHAVRIAVGFGSSFSSPGRFEMTISVDDAPQDVAAGDVVERQCEQLAAGTPVRLDVGGAALVHGATTDAWVQVAAAAAGLLRLEVVSGDFDSKLSVYTECGGTRRYSDNSDGVDSLSMLDMPIAHDGVNSVFVQVAGPKDSSEQFTFLAALHEFPRGEPHAPGVDLVFDDVCTPHPTPANVSVFGSSGRISGDFVGPAATPSPRQRATSSSACSGTDDDVDVWFTFQVPFVSLLTLSARPSSGSFTLAMSLHKTCDVSDRISCQSSSSEARITNVLALPGVDYHVRMAGYRFQPAGPFDVTYRLDTPGSTALDDFVDTCDLASGPSSHGALSVGDSLQLSGVMLGKHNSPDLDAPDARSADAWFFVQPAESGSLTLTMTRAMFDSTVSVYDDCSAGSAPLARDDDGGSGTLSLLSLNVQAHKLYGVRVAIDTTGKFSSQATFDLTVQLESIATAYNDSAVGQTCDASDVLPMRLHFDGIATLDGVIHSKRETWLVLEPAAVGIFVAEVTKGQFDSRLEGFVDCAGQAVFNDDDGGVGKLSKIEVGLRSTAAIHLKVSSYYDSDDGKSFSFRALLQPLPRGPAHSPGADLVFANECTGAPLSILDQPSGTLSGDFVSVDATPSDVDEALDVWLTFEVTQVGQLSLVATPDTDSFTMVFGVYAGCTSRDRLVYARDDESVQLRSMLVIPGQRRLLLRMAGYGLQDVGPFDVAYTITVPSSSVTDQFADACDLSAESVVPPLAIGQSINVTGTIFGKHVSPGLGHVADAWYVFEATARASVLVTVLDSGFDVHHQLYSGCAVNDTVPAFTDIVDPGRYAVRVRIDDPSSLSDDGSFQLNIALSNAPVVYDGDEFVATCDAASSASGLDISVGDSVRFYATDAWTKVSPVEGGILELEVMYAEFDTVLTTYTACGQNADNYDDDGGQGRLSRLRIAAYAGKDMLVRVAARNEGTRTGTFTLNAVLSPYETGDPHPLADRTVFGATCDGPSASVLLNASSGELYGDFTPVPADSTSLRFPCSNTEGSLDVWAKLQVDRVATLRYSIDATSTTRLAASLYAGCDPDTRYLTCYSSTVMLPGVTYRMRVSPQGISPGVPFTITYELDSTPAMQFADTCADAMADDVVEVDLGGRPQLSGRTFGATASPGFGGDADIWFRVELDHTGQAALTVTADEFSVFASCNGADPSTALDATALQPGTYLVRVVVDDSSMAITFRLQQSRLDLPSTSFADDACSTTRANLNLALSAVLNGTLRGKTPSLSGNGRITLCASSLASRDGFVQIASDNQGILTMEVSTADFKPVLSVHGHCDGSSVQMCAADRRVDADAPYRVMTPIQTRSSIFVRLAALDDQFSSGTFSMSFSVSRFDQGEPSPVPSVFSGSCRSWSQEQLNASSTLYGDFVNAIGATTYAFQFAVVQRVRLSLHSAAALRLQVFQDCYGAPVPVNRTSGTEVTLDGVPGRTYALQVRVNDYMQAGAPFAVALSEQHTPQWDDGLKDACSVVNATLITKKKSHTFHGHMFGRSGAWAMFRLNQITGGYTVTATVSTPGWSTKVGIASDCGYIHEPIGTSSTAVRSVFSDVFAVRVVVSDSQWASIGDGTFTLKVSVDSRTSPNNGPGSGSEEDSSYKSGTAGLIAGLTLLGMVVAAVSVFIKVRRDRKEKRRKNKRKQGGGGGGGGYAPVQMANMSNNSMGGYQPMQYQPPSQPPPAFDDGVPLHSAHTVLSPSAPSAGPYSTQEPGAGEGSVW